MDTAVITSNHRRVRQPAVLPESRAPVLPEQVWRLLTPLQQQQVRQVVIQAGRSLVQCEVEARRHDPR